MARTRAGALGLLLVAQGLAAATSSWAWGLLADRSSRQVLVLAGLLAAALAAALFLVTRAGDPPAALLVGALYGLAVAHAGVRMGRKTFVVDLARTEQRSTYVAVSNTVIGVWLVAAGALVGLLATRLEPVGVIAVLGAVSLGAVALAAGLPEVQEPEAD